MRKHFVTWLPPIIRSVSASTRKNAFRVLRSAGNLNRCKEIPQQDSNALTFARLSKAFASQVDALTKLRRGGEQKVTVDHVHVYPGGQAIVGAVTHTGAPRAISKIRNNPMHRMTREPLPLRETPRCGAKTRSGKPCQSPAVRGRRRCRMHGGADGSGAPSGSRNGNYRHGFYTAEAIAERRVIRQWVRDSRKRLDET